MILKKDCCKHPSTQAAAAQKPLVSRLNRIEGQIRGIKRMIEEDVYCDDIINQINASRAALREVQSLLLNNHIRYCVKEQLEQGQDDVIEELIATVRKMSR